MDTRTVGTPLHLRATPVRRLLSGLPLVLVALLLGAMEVGALLDGGVVILMVLMVPIIALLLWAAVRSFRLELVLTDDALTVRGLARTRTVPRSAIDAVLPSAGGGVAVAAVLFGVSGVRLPTVRWHAADGSARITPLFLLAPGGASRPSRWQTAQLATLQEWAAERQAY
ncbi:hypothetical protein [Streptacidiphilus sp. PAMC 29251]